MTRGALVLCGGRSRRMGRDKATLAFGGETLLERVVARLGDVVDEIVVVARPGQPLPPLPESVRIARDPEPDRGPLMGLLAGLDAGAADAFFATAVDAPFLVPAVVDLLFDRLEADGADAAVVEAEGYLHPLTAVYRRHLAAVARRLVEADRMRPVFLFEAAPTARIREDAVRAVDPELASLANCNTPEAYDAALRRLDATTVVLELYEMARRLAGRPEVRVEADTLGEALTALGRRHPALVGPVLARGGLATHWRASVGGRTFTTDPATPLAAGDRVVLVSALAGG